MSVYDDEISLPVAINSILNQSFSAFKLIIVNDGSNDSSQNIIDFYVKTDERVSCIVNKSNKGLAYSLNKAIVFSDSMYIARMDADDYAHPNRLEMQIKYLQQHQGVDVLGSAANVITPGSLVKNVVLKPKTHSEIVKIIEVKNPFFHSSVLIKRSFFNLLGGYDEKFKRAQDYDLWLRGVDRFKYHNLEEPLMDYFSKNQTSKSILYGFKVRIINSLRRDNYISGTIKAVLVLTYGFIVKAKRAIIQK